MNLVESLICFGMLFAIFCIFWFGIRAVIRNSRPDPMSDETAKLQQMKLDEVGKEAINLANHINNKTYSDPVAALFDLETNCKEQIDLLIKKMYSDREIQTILNTKTRPLNKCGVSKESFWYDLALNNPLYTHLPLLNDHNEFGSIKALEVYRRVSLRISQRIMNYSIDKDLKEAQTSLKFYRAINDGTLTCSAKEIPLEDILYFRVIGQKQYVSIVQSGDVNLQGAVAGAIVGGTAGAIIGSQVGTNTYTNVEQVDDRVFFIAYKVEDKTEHLTIKSDSPNFEQMVKIIRQLMPQKEYEFAIANQQQNGKIEQKTVEQKTKTSDADEIKKFKALLDDGVITQEEFDAKKKQLLGL